MVRSSKTIEPFHILIDVAHQNLWHNDLFEIIPKTGLPLAVLSSDKSPRNGTFLSP